MQFQNTGEKLINEIECYQQAYGVLPEEMQVLEWGYDSGVGPFYEKKNDSTYTVYFCLGFDEYYIYDSDLMNIISTIQSKRNGMTSHNFKF